MMWTALLESEAASDQENVPEPPLEWLLAMLKQSMEELMAGEAPPLPKANAIARLGSLFLRTYRAAELEQENRALKERVVELEEALARAADLATDLPATPDPVSRAAAPEPAALPAGPPLVEARPVPGRPVANSRSRGQPAKRRARQHR